MSKKPFTVREHNRLTTAAEKVAAGKEAFSCTAIWRGSRTNFDNDKLVKRYAEFFGMSSGEPWDFDEHAFTGIPEVIAEEDRVAKEARTMAILLFQHLEGRL